MFKGHRGLTVRDGTGPPFGIDLSTLSSPRLIQKAGFAAGLLALNAIGRPCAKRVS